ncbi:hypothetical protein [Rhodobacter sp. 24-YEA-8]|uniref:hypothetical protein n=1 Tax=Rhodobacter sp. 24-YEA-8 TaxID=1884310 RepID=UPI000896D811|nr:hypothetical protein [Rhodobacter sp. 24-YEA-8]SEC61820.1 hypothetical protein SAMN05519105_2932 [Rhodobacter sp. 24-YEA-8]
MPSRKSLRAWFRAALVGVCLVGLAAGQAEADTSDLTRNAFLSGSERLRLRAFGTALEAGRLGPAETLFMRRELLAQGYGVEPGQLSLTARRLSFAPVLGWDGNINGGVLQDRLTIGGLVLEADPAFRAKAGLVFGGAGGAMARFAWGPGRVVELTAGGELAWSPRHEIGRADAALSLCSRNHLQDWVFLDLCALGTRSWRELDTSNAHRLSAELSKVFAAGGSVQQAGLRYEAVSTSGGMQDRLRLSLERIGRAGVSDIALTLGAKVDETTVLRQRIEAGYSWARAGRDWRIDLWHQRAEGGAFLGQPREDRSHGFGLSASLRPGVTLRLGVMSSRSTAAIADYDQITFDIRFSNLLR